MDTNLKLPEEFVSALAEALDKANVPMRQHLMVVKALQRRMEEHKKDMLKHGDMLDSYAATLEENNRQNEMHSKQIEDWNTTSQHLLKIDHLQGDPGESGYTPIKGVDYQDGKDADEEAILNRVLEMLPNFIPDPVPGKDAEFDEDALTARIISKIKKEKPFDMSHIKGAQSFVKDGVKYKFEELMHGGGGSSNSTGTQVYNEIVFGSGTSWALAFTPLSGTLRLFANGQRLTPGTGNDYTLSGTTITTVNSYSAGSLLADYSH